MSADSSGKWPKEQGVPILKKLLGSLELEIMELMWQAGRGTVQQVAKAINHKRPIAYTTVMTVMGHLVTKRLLVRTREGKKYRPCHPRPVCCRKISPSHRFSVFSYATPYHAALLLGNTFLSNDTTFSNNNYDAIRPVDKSGK